MCTYFQNNKSIQSVQNQFESEFPDSGNLQKCLFYIVSEKLKNMLLYRTYHMFERKPL